MVVKKVIRFLLAAFFLVMFVWFLLPCSVGIINAGNFAGALISGGLAAAALFRGSLSRRIGYIWHTAAGRTVIIISGVIFAAAFLLAAIISIFMIKEINDNPVDDNTTLVVLGCKVKGTSPSLMLKRRLDTAYDYLSEHPDVTVIVSGGKGDDEEISEAQCMSSYLIARGISPQRIIMEDKSTTTQENIRFSKAIIREKGLPEDITIVTDGYHQFRADMFAEREGLRAYNISAPTALWILPTYWVREWFGIAYYMVF